MGDSKSRDAISGHKSTQMERTREAVLSKQESGYSASDANSPSAIIGAKIRIKGELIGEENLIIQGYVEGTIDLRDNSLTIGKDGKLMADVSAKMIMVEGEVQGDLFGEERVIIKKTSNVQGNIVAERLSIEDGAKFRGSIDMGGDAREAFSEKTKAMEEESFNDTNPKASAKEKLKKVMANGSASSDKSRYSLKSNATEGAQQ